MTSVIKRVEEVVVGVYILIDVSIKVFSDHNEFVTSISIDYF